MVQDDRPPLVVVGAGIGGLATALACVHEGAPAIAPVRIFERANVHAEYGAGIQMGPNVTRVLARWGLLDDLRRVACAPAALQVRDVADGRHLGRWVLGAACERRYGAPYWTVHRRDLLDVLVRHVEARRELPINLGEGVRSVEVQANGSPLVRFDDGRLLVAAAVVGADGVGSVVRQALPARIDRVRSGRHVALRTLVAARDVDAEGLLEVVSVWLGPHHHIVMYPVQSASMLNVVVCIDARHVPVNPEGQGWAARVPPLQVHDLLERMGAGLCDPVRRVLDAAAQWGAWPLTRHVPVRGARDLAHGAVALLGDAAHPTLPYLAQGAGMAIEDAAVLARCLQGRQATDWPDALQRYARARHARCARIQARSARNGQAFHATGVVRLARDLVLSALGPRIMDLPWLYGWQVEEGT